jgi:hypothetical protein
MQTATPPANSGLLNINFIAGRYTVNNPSIRLIPIITQHPVGFYHFVSYSGI